MSLHILVISDNDSFSAYLCTALGRKGYSAAPAPEGVDPHRVIRKEKPGLVIVAVDASRVPSVAVEHRLHTPNGVRPVPTIVISECLRLEAELLHIYDFIPKPLDLNRLLDDVAAIAARGPLPACSSSLNDRQYQELSGYILSCTGLHFEARNRAALERGVGKRMSALLMDSCGAYLSYLKKYGDSRHELQKLLQFLTVGETYFFRYPAQFEVLKEKIAAKALAPKEPIRIWSAGCSTGEEPYSIAMTVMEALPDWRSRDIRIFATDINNQSLKRARDGVYNPWSIRSTERHQLERYFRRIGESFVIRDEVKKMVQFHHLNLSAPVAADFCDNLTDLDAIFCRNVLIYFSPEKAAQMVQKFAGRLKPSGQLYLGHAEAIFQRSPELEARREKNTFYYVRPALAKAPSPAPSAPPAAEVRAPLLRPVPPPARQEPTPAQRMAAARELFDAEAHQEALKLIDGLLKQCPDHADALVLKGFILAGMGRCQEALETSIRVIAINDLLPEAYFLKGLLLDACDFLQEAADEYRKALLLDHDFIMPRYYMGRLHLRLGRVPEAAREIRNSIRLLAKRDENETVPYSGGLTRSVCMLQLQNALAQVA